MPLAKESREGQKKQKKEASLIAVGVGAAAAAVQKNRTLVGNDDPAAWLIAAGVILPTKVDDEQSTIEKQSPIQESTVEKQNMELEKAAKKANVLAFMMDKGKQKNDSTNSSCVATGQETQTQAQAQAPKAKQHNHMLKRKRKPHQVEADVLRRAWEEGRDVVFNAHHADITTQSIVAAAHLSQTRS